ncbi:RNA polymerase sigma factor [Bacteroidales bacterium OttesenSCG-928-C19]|nr:RNA polymerase sigma factor [Bacteroidales bacterium OttesenSCG-928-C19]
MSKVELLEGIIAGNEDSYKELISLYQSKLKNVAYGIVHNWDDAEDIVQDTFVDVFRNISKFRGDANIATWIYRITINKSLNHIRKHKNKNHTTNSLENLTSKEELKDSNPTEENINEERLLKLNKAIDKLSEKQKTAFTLFYYEEMSQKDIAQIMNISSSAVEQLVFRAKQKLKKQLGFDE